MKISLIQPSRNNLKYLKWSYDSIRKNQGDHEVQICVASDASTDGTWEWCLEMMEKDENFDAICNFSEHRLGHTILYDKLVNEVAKHDICMIYHADMYLMPGAIDQIEHKMKDKTIVSLTRIEPPLHPPGPEKMLMDFGIEPEEFKEEELLNWFKDIRLQQLTKITEGIFAPWAFYKKDFQEIGGHDELYAPQSKEDSDIFNRFHLNGIKFVQTWGGCVYHMTCRGSRFAGGAVRNPDGKVFMKNRETDEWLAQNEKASRNFIRKWGHFVKHDDFLKPIVPKKYGVGIVVKNCTSQILHALEPWCDQIFVDMDYDYYIESEQKNTKFNMKDRVYGIHSQVNTNVEVRVDGNRFANSEFGYIQKLSEIISDSGEIGTFNLGTLEVSIKNMETYENNLITN
jgi:glycosyltransferase involved in cell wall biosynthesis|tara:strand:- start:1349 stop:2545 length:1197 start_codon:yes stop_codon:yes gene_type:complete